MPTDTITPTLVINKLTKAQYEGITSPSDTELYLVPDDDLREHRSYYTTGTAMVDGETVDVDIMYEGVAPEGSVETDAVWTITTIVATLDGNVLSNDVDTDQTWDFPTPTPVVPVIGTTLPICYPTTASEVKTTSMVVKSSVSDNGKILIENGFVYNTSGNPTVSDTKVICDLGAGFFEKKLENLTLNTEYHIKSYGQNSNGLVYGSELVQRTLCNPIPVEYQLVEYLQSGGTQYINTMYIPNINHTITSVMAVISNTNNGYSGCSNVNNRCFWGVFSTTGLTIANSSGSWAYLSLPFDMIKRTFVLSNTVVSIDNTTSSNLNTYPNLPIYLFARNNNGNVTDYGYFRLESFIVTDENNNYVVRMYPVYCIADNKPGMYDIVNNVFYTNQGTGEFTVGPDKEFDEE